MKSRLPGYRPLIDHDGYFASVDGLIYSQWKWGGGPGRKTKELRPLKSIMPSPNSYKKYLIVNLRNPGGKWRTKSHDVHILVCEAFHGPRPYGQFPQDYHASHVDGDRYNNQPNNLKWETRQENEARKENHGTIMHGSKNGWSKLDESDVLCIRDLLTSGMTQTEIARSLSISQQNVSDIKRRKRWRHI